MAKTAAEAPQGLRNEIASFLKLLAGFAPWIAFLAIARGSFFRLELGLVVALLLSVVFGALRLQKGTILWVSLAFFVYAALAIFVFKDMWTVKHLGIEANAALAVAAWATIAIGKPFTLDYAKAETDPALWTEPAFLRTNTIITAVWAAAFSANAALAWGKMLQILMPDWGYEVLSYFFLIGAALFTTWYAGYVRRRRRNEG